MAGECLSYGAFGGYSTVYNRIAASRPSYHCNQSFTRSTKSWKNFLPGVTGSNLAENVFEQEGEAQEYDHEKHVHITGTKPEVTWVIQRYKPQDPRTYAPVPRHKYVCRHDGTPPPAHWVPPKPDSDPELAKFSRSRLQRQAYGSMPYTRDEHWSTLREMLPSQGRAVRNNPPDWGASISSAPIMTSAYQRRFPIIDSPMSRFVSDMHLTNRQFKLF